MLWVDACIFKSTNGMSLCLSSIACQTARPIAAELWGKVGTGQEWAYTKVLPDIYKKTQILGKNSRLVRIAEWLSGLAKCPRLSYIGTGWYLDGRPTWELKVLLFFPLFLASRVQLVKFMENFSWRAHLPWPTNFLGSSWASRVTSYTNFLDTKNGGRNFYKTKAIHQGWFSM